jgi:hypothetical protein
MVIKRFAQINEETNTERNSRVIAYYEKEGYITHKDIPNEKALLERIEQHIQKSWDIFAEAHHPLEQGSLKLEITQGRDGHYVSVNSGYSFTGHELGIFYNSIKKAEFSFFGGRKIRHSGDEVKKAFYFVPYVWSNVNISYELMSGGTNGADVKFDGDSSNVIYDILEGIWYTQTEYVKKNKI